MRVALLGNVANSHARIAHALRSVGNIDAHVFVDEQEAATNQPSHVLNEQETVGWVHPSRFLTPGGLIAPWRAGIVNELSRFDAVIASGYGPLFAQFTKKPWAFLVTGADLTIRPFPLRVGHFHQRPIQRLSALPIGMWQRRGIRRASSIWSQPFSPFTSALGRLRCEDRVNDGYLPLPLDTHTFRPRPVTEITDPVVKEAVDGSDFVVFHPSRIIIRGSEAERETGQVKRNDILIRGFANFVRSGVVQSPRLVLTDWTQSRDVEAILALVHEERIEANVTWLRPLSSGGLSQEQMRGLYAAAQVVADDFGVGWFGYVALEALAMGKPVVTHVDETVISQLYPWHPFCLAITPEDINRQLTKLATDTQKRADVEQKSRSWIEEFHSPHAIYSLYEEALKNLTA